MSALRTTWPTRCGLRACALVVAALMPLGVAGCGTPTPPGPEPSPHAVGSNDPAWIVSRFELPPPDIDKINYDSRTRTLTLYDLPRNGRWEVQLPGEDVGRPVPPQHRLPDVDMGEVYVYYTQSGQKSSATVTVKQIQECSNPYVSLAERK